MGEPESVLSYLDSGRMLGQFVVEDRIVIRLPELLHSIAKSQAQEDCISILYFGGLVEGHSIH